MLSELDKLIMVKVHKDKFEEFFSVCKCVPKFENSLIRKNNV